MLEKTQLSKHLKQNRDINKILIAEGSQRGQMQQITQLAKESNVIVQFVPKKKIDQISDQNHQGVLAYIAAYQYAELDDLFAAAEKKQEPPFFLFWMKLRTLTILDRL